MTDKLRKVLSVAIRTVTVTGLLSFVTALVGQESNKPTGTGFVVDPNGYILTCHHVINEAGKVEVAIGGKTYEATVLASDEKHDLALLEIKAKGLAALPLANSNQVEEGQEVRAFGFPISSVLGTNVKVTRGTVSGIETKDALKVFQIDAPVNPGNSGGPLVNEQGEVVGVVNAKLAGTVVSNVGFAVPINYAKPTLRDNGVEFATAGSPQKLDGPALVKRVSPSVVLITVTPKGAGGGGTTTTPTPPATPPPPSRAEEMKKAQADAYAELKKKGFTTPPGMVLVPAGEFEMEDGSKVALNAYWVDKTEVTNAEFEKFVKASGYQLAGSHDFSREAPNEPIVNVTWADAVAYAKWAGKRLPTEAEWEKAARGTDRRAYPWGNDFDAAKANGEGQADGYKGLAPVGAFKDGASPWGALDMAGNVWEWCSNDFGRSVGGDSSRDYKGLSKVIRGGSFASSEKGLRCGQRAALMPNLSLNELGFRCVKDEPNLPAVPRPTSPVPAVTEWEGILKFKGETAELKCTPKFDQATFQTALGTLTLRKEYIVSLAPNEVQLLGGSVLKGKLQDATLPVLWSLDEQQIAAAEVERYQRAIEPPVVSVGVTKDGDIVPPEYDAQVMLTDESTLLCNFQEKELHVQAVGVGDVNIACEKIRALVGEGESVKVALRDGNTVKGKLLGDYHLALLEGTLTLSGTSPLRLLTFAGGTGMVAGVERNWLKDGSVMVYIPAGEFLMGSPAGEGRDDEHPQRKVTLDAFWIDKTEVTNEQYGKFLDWMKKTNDHSKCFKGEPDKKDHTPGEWTNAKWNGAKQPVVSVDWFDAYAYAAWAGKRLPTEAEWEKAARGTDGRKFPWGNEWDSSKCNSSEANKGGTMDVGSLPEGKSPYGCLDMAGNVTEWCGDYYDTTYYGNAPARNPAGPSSGGYRVYRGGSWSYDQSWCRAASRFNYYPYSGSRRNSLGFRCACVR